MTSHFLLSVQYQKVYTRSHALIHEWRPVSLQLATHNRNLLQGHTIPINTTNTTNMPPFSASPVDVTMIFEPDLQNSGLSVSKTPFLFRHKRVRFASQLTVVAFIPADYRLPLVRAPPPRLTVRQIQEKIKALTKNKSSSIMCNRNSCLKSMFVNMSLS